MKKTPNKGIIKFKCVPSVFPTIFSYFPCEKPPNRVIGTPSVSYMYLVECHQVIAQTNTPIPPQRHRKCKSSPILHRVHKHPTEKHKISHANNIAQHKNRVVWPHSLYMYAHVKHNTHDNERARGFGSTTTDIYEYKQWIFGKGLTRRKTFRGGVRVAAFLTDELAHHKRYLPIRWY